MGGMFRKGNGITAVFIIGGLVWIGRSVLELVFQPNYWNPQTAVDYTAVASFTLALFLLGWAVWLIHRRRQGLVGWHKWLWLIGVTLTCVGAVAAGSANFIEDWLAVKAFGNLFVFGSFALFVGLLLAGISIFGATDVSRWTGWLLIACAIGLGAMEQGGGFLVGIALIVLNPILSQDWMEQTRFLGVLSLVSGVTAVPLLISFYVIDGGAGGNGRFLKNKGAS